jgi:hypothetical protein
VFTNYSASRTIVRMNETEAYEKFEQDVIALANQYSITRLKVSTINFDRDYRRGEGGDFHLVSTKAVIRVMGKVSKVPIGEGCEFQTYDEAHEATKKYWSEYYKGIRAKRPPEQMAAEARRQKRYRERRASKESTFQQQK